MTTRRKSERRDGRDALTVRLPRALMRRLRAAADGNRRTLNAEIV